jgi:hypothetical protein
LIAPLGLLPPEWGAIGMNLPAVSGLIALCIRLGKPWVALLVGVSFIFVFALLDGNVEGLVLWGLAIAGPAGLLLLSVKPQVAFWRRSSGVSRPGSGRAGGAYSFSSRQLS